jgi:hypothetical protein
VCIIGPNENRRDLGHVPQLFRRLRAALALLPVPASVNRKALDAGDTLRGLQRHYCAGSGPTVVVFTSFAGLEKHLRSTRPGDDFMLVSVR